MVIEWLEFQVPVEERERYVQLDDQIWTSALQQYPGFISKETWIDPQDLERVVLVIHWQSREVWKAIPEAELTEIEQRFDAAFDRPYQMIASREFQIRRFPVGSTSPS
ncbi:MAG: TIGR03792 family protein [Leptolyngbyaceae cyanobacterium]